MFNNTFYNDSKKRFCHNTAIRWETRLFLSVTLQEVQRDGLSGCDVRTVGMAVHKLTAATPQLVGSPVGRRTAQ